MAGIGARHFEDFAVGEMNSTRQAIRAFRYIRLGLSEGRRRAAIFGLFAMGDDCLYSKGACYLPVRFAPHAIRQDIQVQSRRNLVAVFVVLSNASQVGACSRFYAQRCLIRLAKRFLRLERSRRSQERVYSNSRRTTPQKSRLTNRCCARNTI